MPPNDEREKQQQMMFQPVMPPHMGQDNNRIDVNLIAMLLWQSLLVGVGVYIASKGIYLESATPATKGLQYGLICFGFLCASMVLFHVGVFEIASPCEPNSPVKTKPRSGIAPKCACNSDGCRNSRCGTSNTKICLKMGRKPLDSIKGNLQTKRTTKSE